MQPSLLKTRRPKTISTSLYLHELFIGWLAAILLRAPKKLWCSLQTG
jgi:hypothetical protein